MAVRYVQLHISDRLGPERNLRAQVNADEMSKGYSHAGDPRKQDILYLFSLKSCYDSSDAHLGNVVSL